MSRTGNTFGPRDNSTASRRMARFGGDHILFEAVEDVISILLYTWRTFYEAA